MVRVQRPQSVAAPHAALTACTEVAPEPIASTTDVLFTALQRHTHTAANLLLAGSRRGTRHDGQ
jgi:hypothetical protein